jgi:hypothetical protein
MLDNQLEMPLRDAGIHPITAEIAAINDINRSFLQVLTHPATRGLPQLLGLDGGVLEALHQLDSQQLDKVASSPLLLAEFSSVPGEVHSNCVAEPHQSFAAAGKEWERQLHSFADRLLTCLWQAARHDKLLASFCLGFDADKCNDLAHLSFTKISHCSDQAAGCLQARLGSHPRFWADLIRAVRTGTSAQQIASQLAGIQLSILEH